MGQLNDCPCGQKAISEANGPVDDVDGVRRPTANSRRPCAACVGRDGERRTLALPSQAVPKKTSMERHTHTHLAMHAHRNVILDSRVAVGEPRHRQFVLGLNSGIDACFREHGLGSCEGMCLRILAALEGGAATRSSSPPESGTTRRRPHQVFRAHHYPGCLRLEAVGAVFKPGRGYDAVKGKLMPSQWWVAEGVPARVRAVAEHGQTSEGGEGLGQDPFTTQLWSARRSNPHILAMRASPNSASGPPLFRSVGRARQATSDEMVVWLTVALAPLFSKVRHGARDSNNNIGLPMNPGEPHDRPSGTTCNSRPHDDV